MIHSRCRAVESALREQSASMEATLRAMVDDLQVQLGRVQDEAERYRERAEKTTQELLDRVIALTNPAALRAVQPTVPMPVIQKDKAALAGKRERGLRAALTPAQSGFRPGTELPTEQPGPDPNTRSFKLPNPDAPLVPSIPFSK